MNRSTLIAAAFAVCLATTRIAHADGGASLNICNHSTTHALHIAMGYFQEGGNGITIDEYPFHSVGWTNIKANSCYFLFTDAPLTNRYWLRIESEGRLIHKMDSGSSNAFSSFDESQQKFCTDREVGFNRNYKAIYSTAYQCGDSMPAELYPITFKFDWGGNVPYTIHVNPDPWIAKNPAEAIKKVPLGPAIPLADQKLSTVGFECTCGSHWPRDDKAQAAISHSKLLVCTYFAKPYAPGKPYQKSTYWLKAPPPELQAWMADEPEWAGIYGLTGLEACPADSNAAGTLDRKQYVDYKRAISSR